MKPQVVFRLFIKSRIWVLLFLIGCGRGCSCTQVIDSTSEKRKIDGIEVSVTAQKLETTTSYIFKKRAKEYAYAFEFSLKLPHRSTISHLCHRATHENGDVNTILKQFNITFSPDKRHFAIGYDNEVYNVYHLLEQGIPFTSHHYLEYDQEHVSFNSLNWDNYPAPEIVAKQLIEGDYLRLHPHEQDLIEKALQTQPVPCEFDIYLIDAFPSQLAMKVFKDKRAKSLTKQSEDWRNKAKEKVLTTLDSKEYRSEAFKLTNRMQDPELYSLVDKEAVSQWLISGEIDVVTHPYLMKRIQSKSNPIDITLQNQLIDRANLIIVGKLNDVRLRNSSITNAFELLIALNRMENFQQAFERMFNPKFKYDYNLFSYKMAMENFEKFPQSIQKTVLLGFKEGFSEMDRVSQKRILPFLKKHVTSAEYEQFEAANTNKFNSVN